MQKLFENFRGWVNEQEAADAPAAAQAKKSQLTFGEDAQCKYFTPEIMKKIGFPFDKSNAGGVLHSYHLHLPIKNDKGVIAWIGRAYDKKGRSRFYGIAPIAGGDDKKRTTGDSQLITFKAGTVLPAGDGIGLALQKIIKKVMPNPNQVEIPSANTVPEKFASFSFEIASGKKPVNYCKGPGKAAPQKKVETDDICNQKLVLNVQKKFSKRLPGVELRHADDEIIISICKIQRMLNNLGLKIEVDGIIGPQTVRALQKAYTQLKPSKKNVKT